MAVHFSVDDDEVVTSAALKDIVMVGAGDTEDTTVSDAEVLGALPARQAAVANRRLQINKVREVL